MGGANDGSSPHAGLIHSQLQTPLANEFYGMTELGGEHEEGVIFKYETVHDDFRVLFSFHGKVGTKPHGSLVADPDTSMLYGMTRHGGKYKNKKGVVFSFNLRNNELTVLHDFEGGPGDGATPYHGNLIFAGEKYHTLYGLTYAGGKSNLGVVFSVGVNGKGFRTLHEFAGGETDGAKPHGSLTYHNGAFYGTTYGGPGNNGTVFRIQPDGSGYEVLHFFNGTDGTQPGDNLLVAGYPGPYGALYGMTKFGGTNTINPSPDPPGNGTIFAILLD